MHRAMGLFNDEAPRRKSTPRNSKWPFSHTPCTWPCHLLTIVVQHPYAMVQTLPSTTSVQTSGSASASTGSTTTRSSRTRPPSTRGAPSHLVYRSRWTSNSNVPEAAPLLALATNNINYQSRRSSSVTPPSPTGTTSASASGSGTTSEDETDEDPAFIRAVYLLSSSILIILLVVFLICVCGVLKIVRRRAAPNFNLASTWVRNGIIAREFGCDGSGESMPLWFMNVPSQATNLVILLVNADTNKVHWLVTGLPLPLSELPANASSNTLLMPNQAEQHVPYWVCHYRNRTQTYVLNIYAIDGKASMTRIKAYTSASEMMHGFGGVPTARLLGRYGGMLRYSASSFAPLQVDNNYEEENSSNSNSQTQM